MIAMFRSLVSNKFQLPAITATTGLRHFHTLKRGDCGINLKNFTKKEIQATKEKQNAEFYKKYENSLFIKKHPEQMEEFLKTVIKPVLEKQPASEKYKINCQCHIITEPTTKSADFPGFDYTGNIIILSKQAFDYSPAQSDAILAYIIGCIRFDYSVYRKDYNACSISVGEPTCLNPYRLLLAKRAATYSALQSKENCAALLSLDINLRIDLKEKASTIYEVINCKAPKILENAVIQTALKENNFFVLLQLFKLQANEALKNPDFKIEDLNEILQMCDAPTFLEEILAWHEQNQKY
jgi:hypothetical protein